MKLLSLTAVFIMMTFLAIGQGKYGATPEDSNLCVQNLSVYKNPYFKNKQYKEAVKYWKIACRVCPASRKSLYIDGVKMYKQFIKDEEDAAKKELLVDTLLNLYVTRMEHFQQEGFVKGRMGADMLKYRKTEPEKAQAVLAESFKLQGNKAEAGAIVSYYSATYKIYRKEKTPENKRALLELFPTLADVCEYNIKNQTKENVIKSYQQALANLEKLFSQVASCEDLVEIYSPKFEAAPDDAAMLKSLLKVFDKRDCAGEELYLKAAKALLVLEPSPEAAYAIAQAEAKSENCTEAIKYYNQTAELTEDAELKEKAYLNAAKCYLFTKQAQSAVSYARKALAINGNNGEAYLIIGDAYLRATCPGTDCTGRAKYWAAYDVYAKAKAVDSEVADKANKKMGAVKAQFPRKASCFFESKNEGDSYTLDCWIGVTTTVRVNE